jgi:hypothetical protein
MLARLHTARRSSGALEVIKSCKAIVTGVNETVGVGLVEVYDLDR